METGFLSQQFNTRSVRRFRPLLAVLCLLVSACVTDASSQVGENPISYQVTWLTSPQGGVGPTRAVLRIDEEFAVLDGHTGCHRILGSFTLNDVTGDASFTVPGASRGTCEPTDRETEELLLAALDRAASFQRVDLQLELLDSAGNLLVELAPLS